MEPFGNFVFDKCPYLESILPALILFLVSYTNRTFARRKRQDKFEGHGFIWRFSLT